MDDTHDCARRVSEALSELKHRGCTVLVTGRAPEAAFDEVSANFLGRPPERRSRVFGLLDRDVARARKHLRTAGPGNEPAIVVDAMADAPRTAAAADASLRERPVVVRRTDYSLSGFETELGRAIDDVRRLHGPFEPAQLRVCVDSLRPLAERYDVDALRGFLESLSATIVDARGIGHFVFPGGHANPSVRSLGSAFDVVVELRNENDHVEQRWRFREYDVASPWIRL
jgi:hypothetical protein